MDVAILSFCNNALKQPSPRSLMSHVHSSTWGRTVMVVKNSNFKNVYQASMFKGEPLSSSNSGSYCRQALVSSISSPSGPPIQMSPKQLETFKHHLGQVDAYIFELHLLSRLYKISCNTVGRSNDVLDNKLICSSQRRICDQQ